MCVILHVNRIGGGGLQNAASEARAIANGTLSRLFKMLHSLARRSPGGTCIRSLGQFLEKIGKV